MVNKSIVIVPEWLFDKINDAARSYHMMLVGEYVNGELDHTQLRVEQVLGETEKAYKVACDAETVNGTPKTWTAWIPKSVIA